jgi:RNA polymerase sigma-70 factor (ECF subfamily)
MLGTVEDAEDVVQDAFERLERHDGEVRDPQRFLMRVVTNLAIDRLRAEKVRRRDYVGPWLPEPVGQEAPLDLVELGEELSLGFMLLLDALSPAERVVFVLREGFDFSFDDIASILELSPAACRQRHSRAKKHLQGPPTATRPVQEKRLLERLVEAVSAQRVEAVVELLSEDAVVLTDGGGVVSAAIRPVTGVERIAQVILHIAGRTLDEEGIAYGFERVSGSWALVIRQHGRPHSCITVDVDGECIERIYVMRNPRKLSTFTHA